MYHIKLHPLLLNLNKSDISKLTLVLSVETVPTVVMSQLYYIGRKSSRGCNDCKDSMSEDVEDLETLTNQNTLCFFRWGDLKRQTLKWNVSHRG